ncbi:MAG: hypothetical protein PHH28_14990, partial [Desulfuromonadaceae bacterium]|nr:hypothetical protein [Desulfuromonadaceae bacterium]
MNIARHVGSLLQGVNPVKIVLRSVPYFAGSLFFAGLLFAAWRASLFSSREQRVLNRFLHTVEHEYGTIAGAGLFEIALLAENRHVSDFVEIYASAVYHDRRLTDDEYFRLRQILRILKR